MGGILSLAGTSGRHAMATVACSCSVAAEPSTMPSVEYLDTAAVAALLGVRPESVSRYRRRDETFPAPDIVLSGRPGWKRSRITHWAKARPSQGVGGGRPPKVG
jgi:hypothetical protein